MSRSLSSLFLLFVSLSSFAHLTSAQRNIDPAIDRDPVLEQDAKHNLDVAWHYFKAKKAYKAALLRFEETFAAYPQFSKIDEFLYLAGMSSYYLSENKGKQKPSNNKLNRYSPKKLRENAVAYLNLMLEKNPESQYKDEAQKILNELKQSN